MAGPNVLRAIHPQPQPDPGHVEPVAQAVPTSAESGPARRSQKAPNSEKPSSTVAGSPADCSDHGVEVGRDIPRCPEVLARAGACRGPGGPVASQRLQVLPASASLTQNLRHFQIVHELGIHIPKLPRRRGRCLRHPFHVTAKAWGLP